MLPVAEGKNGKQAAVKRDFFGRTIESTQLESSKDRPSGKQLNAHDGRQEDGMVWVSFHEGSSTAVRKPIGLEELMRAF